MNDNPADVWADLTRPPEGLTARLHPASRNVWLALDADGRRHLIVRASGATPDQTLMATRGLRAVTVVLSIEQEPNDVWADLVCLDPILNDTFVTVANDLAEEVRINPSNPLEAVQRTLRTWQWFWGVDTSGLTGERALGLLGELWFIDRWAPFPKVLGSWVGPTGHRHDFSTPAISVEAKATRMHADGAVRHHIANLDQLTAPETGDLYLFSLHLISDPNAANSLPNLISRVRTRLTGHPDLVGIFDERLAQAGWSASTANRHSQAYRIVAEELYRVDEEFPRLTRESFVDGVPFGIDEIEYALDLAACGSWRIAVHPGQATQTLAALEA
jgi:hypothetical protein